MRKARDRGSMMLEAVLILPVFVLIIFFLIQITFVWTAKQMTYYAAYCGARAAMVYNPADYGEDIGGGVVKQAACSVLSWISWSHGGQEGREYKAGGYAVPLSQNIQKQVSVTVSEDLDDGGLPAVTVTVTFKFPLFIPFGGPMMAYFFGASMNNVDTHGAIGLNVSAPNADAAVSGLDYDSRYEMYSVPLTESCTLAKPYRTETFPLMPDADRKALRID